MAISVEVLTKATYTVLKGWRKRQAPNEAFQELRIFQEQLRQSPYLTLGDIAKNLLQRALNELAVTDTASAQFLRERFELQMTMAELAYQYSRSESTLYTFQREAIEALVRILEQWERRSSQQLAPFPLQTLPEPSYHRLFGTESHLAALFPLLLSPDDPWLMALVGIGGIGKTSLADNLARRVVERGDVIDVYWVSAQQVIFSLTGELQSTGQPALTVERLLESLLAQTSGSDQVRALSSVDDALRTLRQRFSTGRYLIVIDNFETTSDIERLLPWLRQLSNPTKILLTSRVHPLGIRDLLSYSVPELMRSDALALMRTEAQRHYFADLSHREDLLSAIYNVVGGNPLALRLTVGQAFLYGVEVVLDDITSARHTGENLYRYIYHYAWSRLDENARFLLLAMPLLPPTGGSLEALLRIAGLTDPEVRKQLAHLITQNLVNVHGTAQTRLYSIHSLTRAFLNEAILHWDLGGSIS